MKSISITELRSQLSRVLDRVSVNKKRIIITRRGKPVAALIPSGDVEYLEGWATRVGEVWERISARMRAKGITEKDIEKAIREVREERNAKQSERGTGRQRSTMS